MTNSRPKLPRNKKGSKVPPKKRKTALPTLRRTNPITKSEEHYCSPCKTYHPLSSFPPASLGNKMYACRNAAAIKSRQYNQSVPMKTRKCRRIAGKLRRRLCNNEASRQITGAVVEKTVDKLCNQMHGREAWRKVDADTVFAALHQMFDLEDESSM